MGTAALSVAARSRSRSHSASASVSWSAVIVCVCTLASPALAGPDEDARALYDQAVAHYDLAEYRQAIAKFKEAYHLSREPLLLFDIAQAYRLAGSYCRNAIVFYRNYLRVKPNASNRDVVEKWLRELEPCATNETDPATAPDASITPLTVSNEPAPAPGPANPPIETARPARSSRWLSWTLVGGGATLVLAGGSGLFWVKGDRDAALGDGCRPDCKGLRDRLELRANVSYALVGIGAALATTGVVLWLRGPSSDKRDPTAYVAPAGSGVVVGGTF